jgi:hypothetical protein
MTAERITKALGGRKVGGSWLVPCPAHDDREPSLSICDREDGKVLVCCHAGCAQAKVISALRSRSLWAGDRSFAQFFSGRRAASNKSQLDDATRKKGALCVFESSAPAEGTLVETYLFSRGLKLLPPPILRFHPRLKHPSGDWWPAMVALVTRGPDNIPVAISRHAAIGIKAERYPLSGGSRFRESGHDLDIYAFGTDERTLVAEAKSRSPDGASLLRWHGEVVTASRTRHDPCHSRVVA